MRVYQEFISAGVNRVVGALAWSDQGTVGYGAHNMVVLYDPKEAEVVATLTGHTSLVGCIAWVPPHLVPGLPAEQQLLVSGSAEGELRVWAVHNGGRADKPWQQLAVLTGHSGPITGLAFHALPGPSSAPASAPRFLMVSTAGDCAMRVWECQPQPQQSSTDCAAYSQTAWTCTETISVGTQMQHSVALTHLPGHKDWLLLVSGGTDSRLHLYLRGPKDTSFQTALKLPGHDGWIRHLTLHHVTSRKSDATELLIATASQDRYGRIWKVALEASSEAPAQASEDDILDTIMRYAPRPGFEAAGDCFSVTLESLLIGHEDWVHTVCWQPLPHDQQQQAVDRTSLCLLTASMDRTMMLWTYEPSSGLWMNVASVGDAGAACLGYFGGVFGPGGSTIMAHGFTGAIHLWERQAPPQTTAATARHTGPWVPRHALGGHWDAVTGVAWGCDGGCVMSASEDQTARIFTATSSRPAGPTGEARQHWCEIARPQVHGHDFSCLAPLPNGTKQSSYAYVSGSEEKVLRVMEGTQAFVETLQSLRESSPTQHAPAEGLRARAFGAAVSALGLTNRMVLEEGATAAKNAGVGSGMAGGNYDEGPDFVPNSTPCVVREPPLEEHLAQNTLWPEGYKLYGHGDMLYCCAASPDGAHLASACVAKSEQQAAVWIWDVAGGTWKPVTQLQAHSLTVTQLAWSHNSELLASCSRDRTFSVYQRVPAAAPPSTPDQQQPQQQGAAGTGCTFRLVHRQKAAHTRIIWGVSWSHDAALLATGARDNLVKVWSVTSQAEQDVGDSGLQPQQVAVSSKPVLTLPAFPAAVTAVAWAPRAVEGSQGSQAYLLAVGLENGGLQLWKVFVADGGAVCTAECMWQSGLYDTCAGQVSSLAWRADGAALGGKVLQLALGAQDHSVRVLRVEM